MSPERGEPGSVPGPALPEACQGCAACVAACPVAASDGGFAGPKVVGPALSRRLEGGWPGEPPLGPDVAAALGAELCLQCHRCDLACPAGVSVSAEVRRAIALAQARPKGRRERFTARLLADQDRVGRLARLAGTPRRLARGASAGVGRAMDRLGLSLLGLSPRRSLPAPPRPGFAAWFEATRRPAAERDRPPVIFFAGCHVRYHDPSAGQAAVALLRACGFRVILPTAICCGAPALALGQEERAAQSAAANSRLLDGAFDRLGGAVPVLSPCPSCTLALRQTLPELVPGGAAPRVAREAWDLGEFLAGPARKALEAAFGGGAAGEALRGRSWIYHTPCHLRALGVGRPFPELLAAFGLGRGLDPGPAADGCCGMGGLAGATRSGYSRSLAAGAPVLEAYRELAAADAGRAAVQAGPPDGGERASAPLVLSDCPGCRWQIGEACGLPTAHPAELLATACSSLGRNSPHQLE